MKKGFAFPFIATMVLANSAMAASNGDGTVHFKGEIVDAPCVVSADSQNQEVNLGQVKTTIFAAKGAKSPSIPFQIKLEECDTTKGKTKVSVGFAGIAAAGDATLISINQEAGSATNVGIGIYDNKSVAVPLNTGSSSTTLVNGQNVLYYSASYVSTATGVTPGYGNADVDFNVTYQ